MRKDGRTDGRTDRAIPKLFVTIPSVSCDTVTAVLLETEALWDVTLCLYVDTCSCRRFEGW
jgi:hypothetical protein